MSSTHSTPPPAYVCKHCSAEHKDKASLKHYESGHIPKSSVVALHISCKESGDDNVVFLTETAGEVQETVKKAAALYMLPSYQEEKKRKLQRRNRKSKMLMGKFDGYMDPDPKPKKVKIHEASKGGWLKRLLSN